MLTRKRKASAGPKLLLLSLPLGFYGVVAHVVLLPCRSDLLINFRPRLRDQSSRLSHLTTRPLQEAPPALCTIGGPLSLHLWSSNRLSLRRGAPRLRSQAEARARDPPLALRDCEDLSTVYTRTERTSRLVVRDPGNSPLRARRLTALWRLAAGTVSVPWWQRFTGRAGQSFVPEEFRQSQPPPRRTASNHSRKHL